MSKVNILLLREICLLLKGLLYEEVAYAIKSDIFLKANPLQVIRHTKKNMLPYLAHFFVVIIKLQFLGNIKNKV